MQVIGTIVIQQDRDGLIRLTINTTSAMDDRLDQLEAYGDELDEALINLHTQVEAILA